MGIEQFFRETYLLPPTVIEYHVSQSLKELFPQKACIEVEDGRFDIEGYADAQQCLLTQKSDIHNQMLTYWLEPGPEVMRAASPVHQRMQHNGVRLDAHHRHRGEETATPGQETMEQVMIDKVATLREQMVSVASLEDSESVGEPFRPVMRHRGPLR